jgi:hypothetical protein
MFIVYRYIKCLLTPGEVKQDGQCKYNVTLRRVHVTFIPPRLSQQPDIISL